LFDYWIGLLIMLIKLLSVSTFRVRIWIILLNYYRCWRVRVYICVCIMVILFQFL